MKKLIVTAHPSSKGFTHTIAKKLEELSIGKGDEVEILNLYTTHLQQPYLTFEDSKEFSINAKNDETIQRLQGKILWADEIVFIFPIWWGDAPAILKNFIDTNFLSGFAFKYENGKPIGLLKGKTARIIATSGAPGFFYKILLHIQFFWNMNRIGFCGLKQKSFTVFGEMESEKTDKQMYLKTLEKLL